MEEEEIIVQELDLGLMMKGFLFSKNKSASGNL